MKQDDVMTKYKIDRQTIVMWLFFFLFVTIYATISYLTNKNITIFILTIFSPVACILIIYYVNKYRFNKSTALFHYITAKYEESEIKKDFIMVKKNSYRMKPLKQSNDVVINPSFEKSSIVYCFGDDFVILFIEITEFAVFKQYCKPIMFSKLAINNQTIMKQVQKIDIYQKEIIESDVIIKSSQFPNDINVLKLPSTIICNYI